MAASPRVTRGDKANAKAFVDHWEALCGAFGFTASMSPAARELLEEVLGYIYSRRELEKVPLGRLAYAGNADSAVQTWLRECRARRYRMSLSQVATQLLAGEMINVIALTRMAPFAIELVGVVHDDSGIDTLVIRSRR